jgi:metal-dependent HD superfamily phosphatase/phosphodiesterase
MITFEQIKADPAIKTYIRLADASLGQLGYTEHSFAHVGKVAETASQILLALGYSQREAELAQIAGWLHDIGNVINRVDHAQSGAVMAFRILDRMGSDPEDIAAIISAIGNHDEGTGVPISPIGAALIISDKTDVRYTRVRAQDPMSFDIHDRVNYAVREAETVLDDTRENITLSMTIDTQYCSVMDYFEIFLGRMLLCRKAAELLRLSFRLVINGQRLL